MLLGACAAAPKEPERPDAAALKRETLVQARTAEVVLSSRYRREAKLEAIQVEKPEPGVETARMPGTISVSLSMRSSWP